MYGSTDTSSNLTVRITAPIGVTLPRRLFSQAVRLRAAQDGDGNKFRSDELLKTLFGVKPAEEKKPAEPAQEEKKLVDGDPPPPKRGSLRATDSIFDIQDVESQARAEEEKKKVEFDGRTRWSMNRVLDADPDYSLNWQRKTIERDVRRRGRLTKAERILRSEREARIRSHFFKTSVKKLAPLARQIAGKRIDDAIVQMRFSKKKAAQDIKGHLEQAKNEAMVRWGMGMRPVPGDPLAKRLTITLKNGERRKIKDPMSIYIAQAWVNRGPYTQSRSKRARGRIDILRHPSTGISVLLKEERTLVREWKERDASSQRKRRSQLWTQLPDRKIYGQNQYYSW